MIELVIGVALTISQLVDERVGVIFFVEIVVMTLRGGSIVGMALEDLQSLV